MFRFGHVLEGWGHLNLVMHWRGLGVQIWPNVNIGGVGMFKFVKTYFQWGLIIL